jgi:hypothetical protein
VVYDSAFLFEVEGGNSNGIKCNRWGEAFAAPVYTLRSKGEERRITSAVVLEDDLSMTL